MQKFVEFMSVLNTRVCVDAALVSYLQQGGSESEATIIGVSTTCVVVKNSLDEVRAKIEAAQQELLPERVGGAGRDFAWAVRQSTAGISVSRGAWMQGACIESGSMSLDALMLEDVTATDWGVYGDPFA